MSRRGRDLFGFDDPRAPAGKGMVQLALHLHLTGKAAWLLSDTGDKADAHWLPFSLGERGEGKRASYYAGILFALKQGEGEDDDERSKKQS